MPDLVRGRQVVLDGELVALGPAGVPRFARLQQRMPARRPSTALLAALTRLSQALWDTYLRPASAADDKEERWRREEERAAFATILESVTTPELPDEHGVLVMSYNPVVESANALGRVLRDLDDATVAKAVLAEAHIEIEAVQAAERGDLTGRAVQAVVLDRVDASPAQVGAADRLLHADPLGTPGRFGSVDPAAACVAAAHWLAAAAEVAAEAAGIDPAAVFAYAGDIEAVSVEAPSLVVESILDGEATPRQITLTLLADAVAVREGRMPDPAGLLARIDDARAQAARFPVSQHAGIVAGLLERITPLDPIRPARDLLEHLLDGIGACLIAYREHHISAGGEPDGDNDPDSVEDGWNEEAVENRVGARGGRFTGNAGLGRQYRGQARPPRRAGRHRRARCARPGTGGWAGSTPPPPWPGP